MADRWGIEGPDWRRIREMPNEERARGWAKTFTSSNASSPWIKLYRDTGDGWVLVETVPAEREHRRDVKP
jgi:hypothetical protein